jgi:hypothetical protein
VTVPPTRTVCVAGNQNDDEDVVVAAADGAAGVFLPRPLRPSTNHDRDARET